MNKLLTCLLALFALSATSVLADIQVVAAPDVSRTNSFYIGNRAPLLPGKFIGLPVGSVEPRGWLREMLQRQRDGLTGHLGEISAWLQKADNAWLSKDGKGKYGWEEVPYWLRGYQELAAIFNDPKMLAECGTWIDGTIASQRSNGDFGPDQRFNDDGSRDYWANMVMLYCLQTHYERTNDARVLELMTRYFKHQLSVPDNMLLTHYWQKMRGADTIHSIHWLYNRTGDADLIKLAEKINRCSADWKMKGDLPNWHNVNIAQGFREHAHLYLQTHDKADLEAAYANHFEIRRRFGQVPGGMFGSDENSRPGYTDPRQATETCGFVEQMLSDEMMFQISGDPFWADHCEDVAFNSYPAAVMPDFKSLRYLTAPNQVVSDSKNHAPGIDNSGPFMMMNPFSSRCCQHNHSHGWPYFNKSLWMATPDNGVCAALYSASEVRVRVGDGTTVRIAEETRYPFEDTIQFKVSTDNAVTFPLYLRIPAWCEGAEVSIRSGTGFQPVQWRDQTSSNAPSRKDGSTDRRDAHPTTGKFVRIEREWKDGDIVTLQLPMRVSVKQWPANYDSVSVNYGPLTFSLKIGERYDRHDSTKTAIGDSSWQAGADPSKWPSFEIHPTTPWNYALMLDATPEKSFTVKHGKWPEDNFPFTTDAAPISMEVKARKVPEWTVDRHGLCAVLQPSPVLTKEAVETVSLIPMGAARLRISAFPIVGKGAGAHQWVAPMIPKQSPYKLSASHCFRDNTVEAIADELVPANSGDHTIPRLTWWDHRGTKEWAQFDFPQAKEVASARVYWFDDTGLGQCRIPKSWRVLYKDGEEWKPVNVLNGNKLATKDEWNPIKFLPVKTAVLRIEVELQPGFSGGILEWQVE